MRLVFLGTTGYHPSPNRHTACLMLPEIGVVLDAGTGFFRVRDFIETTDLEVFLSHAHLDHVQGLTFIWDVLSGRPDVTARVHGRPEDLRAIQDHLFFPQLFPVKFPYPMVPLAERVDLPGGGELHARPLPSHPGGSMGFRLNWPDRSLAYITDTVASREYVEFVRGVDVLVHECYFSDAEAAWATKTGHAHTSAVARLARDAGVGRLVLVHVNPLGPEPDPIGLDQARAIFAPTELAHDLMTLDF